MPHIRHHLRFGRLAMYHGVHKDVAARCFQQGHAASFSPSSSNVNPPDIRVAPAKRLQSEVEYNPLSRGWLGVAAAMLSEATRQHLAEEIVTSRCPPLCCGTRQRPGAQDDFIRPGIVTGICTAMRRGDGCLLKWERVDLRRGLSRSRPPRPLGRWKSPGSRCPGRNGNGRDRRPALRGAASWWRRGCTVRTPKASRGGSNRS